MRHATILVAILAFVPVAGATAQLRPGERVRVAGHFCQPSYSNCVGGLPQRYVGTFVAWKSDTLVVQSNGDTLSVPVDRVTRLDVSRYGKNYAELGGGVGLGIGALAGAFIGYASYGDKNPGIGDVSSPELYALGGAIAGGLVGGGVGALIGALIRTDRWQEMPLDQLRVSLAPQRDGRFGLGLLVRF